MVSVTVSVSREVRDIMKMHNDVNWSGLVRRAILEKVEKLEAKGQLLRGLKEDASFDDWAVGIVREGRK
jgi:hypothetical protein